MMVRAFLFAAAVVPAAAQCGPDGAMPYPPGESVCPSAPPGGDAGAGGDAGGTGAADGMGDMGSGNVDAMALCTSPPCAAALLGRIGATTVAGTDARTGAQMPVGEDIYGPFEAGFGSDQNTILEALGCSSGDLGHVGGGIDTKTAEQMVAYQCNITLPRIVNNKYISLLDECGGHTTSYHFHESLSCLYTTASGSKHSGQVGQGGDGRYLYGKYEDFSASALPQLDACGGHFGATPDSNGSTVYHYHVQDMAPFTFGCFGPISLGGDVYKMVTLAECRALYDGCGDDDVGNVTTAEGTRAYDFWCPCYDRNGSNVAGVELAVFDGPESAYKCSGAGCVSTQAVDVLSSPTGNQLGGQRGPGNAGPQTTPLFADGAASNPTGGAWTAAPGIGAVALALAAFAACRPLA